MRGKCNFTDYFVICSGETEIHLAGIEKEIVHSLKSEGLAPLRREGVASSGWMIIDYGEIVVHILNPEKRRYYSLEELWHQANVVIRIP